MDKFEFITKSTDPIDYSTDIRNYEFRPNVGDEVFILSKDNKTVLKKKIKEYLGRGHAFLYGFFSEYLLNDDTIICSFYIFESEEKIQLELVKYDTLKTSPIKDLTFDEISLPMIKNISPTLIAADIISVTPLFKHEQPEQDEQI